MRPGMTRAEMNLVDIRIFGWLFILLRTGSDHTAPASIDKQQMTGNDVDSSLERTGSSRLTTTHSRKFKLRFPPMPGSIGLVHPSSQSPAAPRLTRHVTRLLACRRCPRMHKPVVSGGPVVSR